MRRACCVLGFVAALSGCGGNSGDDSEAIPTVTRTAATPATPTPGASSTQATASTSPASTATPSAEPPQPTPTALAGSFRAWAVTSANSVLRSENGGGTWETIATLDLATGGRLFGIDFADRTRGWVVGNGIFRTDDGGSSWLEQKGNVVLPDGIDFDLQVQLYDVQVLAPDVAVAVGGLFIGAEFDSLILRTENAGELWQEVPIESDTVPAALEGALRSLCVTPTGLGLTAGFSVEAEREGLATTTDAGISWESIRDRVSIRDAFAVACGGNNFFVVGGMISGFPLVLRGDELWRSQDAGSTWEEITSSLRDRGPISAVFFLDGFTGWAAVFENASALILRTNDGGASWSLQDLPEAQGTITAVEFLDSSGGIAAGGEAFFTSSGGALWGRSVGVPDSQSIEDLAVAP